MAEKAAAPRKAAARKAPAATKTTAAPAEPTAAPKPTADSSTAPAGVLTLETVKREAEGMTRRGPESGPSDASDGVTLTAKDGGRVTVPERMVDAMKAQGFTRK